MKLYLKLYLHFICMSYTYIYIYIYIYRMFHNSLYVTIYINKIHNSIYVYIYIYRPLTDIYIYIYIHIHIYIYPLTAYLKLSQDFVRTTEYIYIYIYIYILKMFHKFWNKVATSEIFLVNFIVFLFSDGLIWFYGISTIVGHLMPNPLYTYILNIYIIWFGRLLWHINLCRLFNAKFFLYIYIKYVWFA